MDGIKTIALLCLRRKCRKISLLFLFYVSISFLAFPARMSYGYLPDSTASSKTERPLVSAEMYETDLHTQKALIPTRATPALGFPWNSFGFLFFAFLVVCFALCIYLITQIKKGRTLLQRELEINRLKS